MSSEQAELLAVVRLSEDYAGWPVGTEGTLVEMYSEGGVVEIADEDGRTLDLLTVPYSVVSADDGGALFGEATGKLGEDRQVGMEPHPV